MTSKTVLVVDDDEPTIVLMKRTLEALGVPAITAMDATQALEALRECHDEIGLVLMDLAMPLVNGLDLTRMIRDQYGLDLPVVALTARTNPETETLAQDAGIYEVITKPFEPSVLRHVLGKWGVLPES